MLFVEIVYVTLNATGVSVDYFAYAGTPAVFHSATSM
jgi:hypothetical protein